VEIELDEICERHWTQVNETSEEKKLGR